MKAMILAAGLGTRLRPWTNEHPKALVPVDGVPMLRRVMERLKSAGFNETVINVHHFSDQILEYLENNPLGIDYRISDESDELLNTGGGILKGAALFGEEPVLVHNVDILSNVDLNALMTYHMASGNDVTLLTSDRMSSRKLLFGESGKLSGWHNLTTDEYKPSHSRDLTDVSEEAFSGIYVIGSVALGALREYAVRLNKKSFPIMDFFLSMPVGIRIGRMKVESPVILDIGKPESLARASELLRKME